jgi:hypothetical protein
MVILCVLFWLLLIGHRIILYRIKNGNCGPFDGFYNFYDNYFQVIFSSLSPAIVMCVLAYMLIKSVRGVVRRRVVPVMDVPSIVIPPSSLIHQMDTQLTLMLVLESLITMVTYVPYAVALTYANITQDWYKSPLRLAWESVFTELIHLFSYIFFASSFYVSMISNVGFRRQVKRLLLRKKKLNNRNHTATVLRTRAIIAYRPNCK